MVAVIATIVVVNFLLIHAAPGDPASVLAGQSGAADARFVEQLRHQFGLDQPLSTQLWLYVSSVARGDLGISHLQQRPVLDLIMERLPATVLLTLTAFVFSLIAGMALGIAAAQRAGSWVDTALTVLALGFYATPIFWVGLMLVLVFSVYLDWLPSFGMMTVGAQMAPIARIADVAEIMQVHGRPVGNRVIELLDAVGLPDPERLALSEVLQNPRHAYTRQLIAAVPSTTPEPRPAPEGRPVLELVGWKPYRKRIQMVFQDPAASLNPRRRVGDIIAEGPVAHGEHRDAARARAIELLRLVQLDPGAADRTDGGAFCQSHP
eukprot:gene4230-4281_t